MPPCAQNMGGTLGSLQAAQDLSGICRDEPAVKQDSDPLRPPTVSPNLLPLSSTTKHKVSFPNAKNPDKEVKPFKAQVSSLSSVERVQVSPFSHQTDTFVQLSGLMHMAEPQGLSTWEK